MDSFNWNIVTIIFLSIVICYFLLQNKKSKHNLPPGPYAFPIIGSIIQIVWNDPQRLMGAVQVLGKKYGPVVSLQMGSIYAIGINGFDAIKELSINPDFMDRINEKWCFDKSIGLPVGVLLSENGFWTKTRTIVYRLIREYGFGRNEQMYHSIMEEVKDYMEVWKSQCSKNSNATAKIRVEDQFQVVMLNIVWSIGAGERFQGHDDSKLKKLSKLTNEFTKASKFGRGVGGLFPKLFYMFPKLTGYSKVKQISHDLHQFFDEIIQERIDLGHYKTLQLNFIDSFLYLVDQNNPSGLENGPKSKTLDSIYTRENLIAILEDFSIAGNDTTANSLNFIIRFVVQNSRVQEKLHEEIDRVVGRNRLVIMEDKPKLVYVQAVIFEALRYSTVAPTVPRRANKDTKFHGFDIPKDTLILPNYYGSNRDEHIWEKPETFIPERFLNSSQTEIINTEKFISFGIGKRNCIGEKVAKTSLFLILTTLLQQFFFEIDPEYGVPSSNTEEALTTNTEPYHIIIRQKQ